MDDRASAPLRTAWVHSPGIVPAVHIVPLSTKAIDCPVAPLINSRAP